MSTMSLKPRAAGVAVVLLACGLSEALAQSRPANIPTPPPPAGRLAPPTLSPSLTAPRAYSVERPPAPVMAPEIVESRPGGCPEGPPCPATDGGADAAATPEDCAEGADCEKTK